MKKKLLKPPCEGFLILPSLEEVFKKLAFFKKGFTAHQPYFFNLGVASKFLFLDSQDINKKFVFVDTDRIRIIIRVPTRGEIGTIKFIDTEEALDEYPTPSRGFFRDFFWRVEQNLRDFPHLKKNFLLFKGILFKNLKEKFLKEVLAKSLLEFLDIKADYLFLSSLLRRKEFKELFKLSIKI